MALVPNVYGTVLDHGIITSRNLLTYTPPLIHCFALSKKLVLALGMEGLSG